MRVVTYVQPVDGDAATPQEISVTEEDIRRTYWPHWKARMEERGLDVDFDQCLEDFITVHWGVLSYE